MPQRRFDAWFIAALLAALAPSARADDAQAAQDFRRAELQESAFGDLKKAADLYRAAADEAGDAAGRARARLREGSCLRRLGQLDDARTLLAPLVAGDGVPDEIRRAAKSELDAASVAAPPPPPAPELGPTADRKKLADTERELEEKRSQFEAALQRANGLEKQTETLASELRRKDEEIRAMRAQIAPSSAEEALRVRIEEQERRHAADRELSRNYASFARRLHQEGRFAEACDFVNVALEKDPENADAKALLTLVSAPLGVRQRLYEAIRGVLALADEVRGARSAADIDTLVAEATRRQQSQDFAASVPPLERALSMIDAEAPYLHDAAASRETVVSMLRTAQSHGAPRSASQPGAATDDAESRGLAAVRELLTFAGAEVARGLDLRFHDAGPALAIGATGLPPATLGAPPAGWTISAEGVATGPLLAQYLRAADSETFAAPGASIEAAGSTIVARCDAAGQTRLRDRVAMLADVAAPALELRVAAHRMPPGDFAALLTRRGIRIESTPAGVRYASVPSADLDAIAPDLQKRGDPWPSVASLLAAPLRPFRMVAGAAAASLEIDVLPASKPEAGLALRVAASWTPTGRADGATLRQEASVGATLDPGAALAVFGLADPTDPSRDLVVLVREGVAPAAPAGRPAAPPAAGLSSSEMSLPASLRGLAEVGPEPVVVLGRPVPSREKALTARLVAVAKSAQLVEVKDERVRVVGEGPARAAARAFLDQIERVRGVQSFDVSVFAVSQDVENHVLGDVPKFDVRDGDSCAKAVLRGADRRLVEQALEGSRGRVPLLESRVSTPPTGRADAAFVLRSSYRRDLELAPGPDASWGRSETALVDRGVLVAIRPFGRRADGRSDLDVALRAAWISDRGEKSRDTPLGAVTSFEPTIETAAGDIVTALADDEILVLARMPDPFAPPGSRTRLVVTIAVAGR